MFIKFKIHQGTLDGSYSLTHLIHVNNIGQVKPKFPQNENSWAEIIPRDGSPSFCVEDTVVEVEAKILQVLSDPENHPISSTHLERF
jgi:hypothetical protein